MVKSHLSLSLSLCRVQLPHREPDNRARTFLDPRLRQSRLLHLHREVFLEEEEASLQGLRKRKSRGLSQNQGGELVAGHKTNELVFKCEVVL